MSSYPDSSPNGKAKSKGGMKNNDGREGPQVGPHPAPFNDKSVGCEPNEGAPELSKKGVVGQKI